MANELQAIGQTGQTHYFLILDDQGLIFRTTTGSFEAYVTANYGDYDIPATELGTASRIYVADFPNGQVEATYGVIFRRQQTGSPAEGDSTISTGGIAISDECTLAVPIPEESSSSSSSSNSSSSTST